MRDEGCVEDARHAQKLIDKVRVAFADAQLDGELDAVVLYGLALDVRLGQLTDQALDLLAGTIVKVQDEQVRHGAAALHRGDDHHDHADDQRADEAHIHKPRAERKAFANRPEHIHRVDRVLDRRTETDDGQRADHAQRKREV